MLDNQGKTRVLFLSKIEAIGFWICLATGKKQDTIFRICKTIVFQVGKQGIVLVGVKAIVFKTGNCFELVYNSFKNRIIVLVLGQ